MQLFQMLYQDVVILIKDGHIIKQILNNVNKVLYKESGNMWDGNGTGVYECPTATNVNLTGSNNDYANYIHLKMQSIGVIVILNVKDI